MYANMRILVVRGMLATCLFFLLLEVAFATSVNYQYDDLNRLKQVEYADGSSILYGYDEVGNRIGHIQFNRNATGLPYGLMAINGGADTTSSYAVTLNSVCAVSVGQCAEMQFSNDSVNWSSVEPYAASKNWILPDGIGTKTVYAKYKDASGNWSSVVSDTILAVDVVGSFLYYPHIASISGWETEIGLINTGDTQLQGTLYAYSGTGVTIETKLIDLPVRGRISYVVGEFFTEHEQIAYMKFVADSSTASGYEKFYRPGNRVAIPAVSRINQEPINISHIASGIGWWTGIALVNTTSEAKTMTFTFSDDSQYSLTLSAGAHWAGTVAGLSGIDGGAVASAQITGAQGVIGLELFGGLESDYLSGILLDDQASTSLYYSHVASNATWWTGIVCYNPGTEATQLTLSPYNSDGVLLSSSLIDIAAKDKYVGTFQGLNLPVGTAWFELESTSPVTGFELFGTNNGVQLAGYTAVNIGRMAGSFAKLEQDGWTGIAFVNASSDNAFVTLTALSDSGSVIATKVLNLSGNEKIVDIAESLFAEDISSATYITFSSNHDVVGFQLNGSTDGTMLDGLPGI